MIENFFSVGLFKSGSMGTNHDDFVPMVERYRFDILAINVTWLRHGEEGRAPTVPGYRLRHVPRPANVRCGRGKGVGFYVRRGLNVRTVSQ